MIYREDYVLIDCSWCRRDFPAALVAWPHFSFLVNNIKTIIFLRHLLASSFMHFLSPAHPLFTLALERNNFSCFYYCSLYRTSFGSKWAILLMFFSLSLGKKYMEQLIKMTLYLPQRSCAVYKLPHTMLSAFMATAWLFDWNMTQLISLTLSIIYT